LLLAALTLSLASVTRDLRAAFAGPGDHIDKGE
jgi:hypothetical protein